MTPSCDLALVDLGHQRLVVGVGVASGVGLDRLEPGQGRGLALAVDDRGHDGLEVRLAGSQAQLALPLGVGQVHHRGGEVGRLQLRGVVDDGRHPSRHAHPVTVGGVVLRRHPGQGGRVELGQEVLLLQGHQGRRVLGVEHVGRRARALLLDLLGQHVLVVGPDLDLDARLGLEGLDQRIGGLLVLAAVEGQAAARRRRPGRTGGVGRAPAARAGGQGEADHRQRRHPDPGGRRSTGAGAAGSAGQLGA